MPAENNKEGRFICLTKLLHAPVEKIWDVWSNPDHIKHWWGPNGFTNTIIKIDLHPGGEWLLVMHGPDGTDYDNRSVFTEVAINKKIAYEHLSGHHFIATIEFEAQENNTLIHWEMLFPTKEEYYQFVEVYKVGESLQQNIDRLAQYVDRID